MPLTGVIPFVGTIGHSTPSGMWALICQDGKHYLAPTITSAPVGIPTTVGCAETNATTITLTEAQWRTDLASLGMGTTGTYNYSAVVPAQGTPYFFVVGGGSISAANESHNVGVRYKIVSTSSIVVDGGFANIRASGGGLLFRGGSVGEVYGAVVIGSALYAVHLLDNPGSWLRNYLVKYDLTGTDANLTAGSWEDRVTHITAWDDGFFTSTTSRQYYNRVSLFDAGSGSVGLLAYIGQSEIDGSGSSTIDALSNPSMLYAVVHPALHICNASVDVSTQFGIPIADTRKKFDGSASSNARDDYTLSIVAGGTEFLLLRPYSDSKRRGRVLQYEIIEGNFVLVRETTTTVFNSAIDASSDIEFIMAYREGGNLLFTARDTTNFYLGQVTITAFITSCCEDPVVVDPDVVTLLSQRALRVAHLVQFDFLTTPKYLWNGFHDLTTGGHTYQGLRKLGAIDGLEDQADMTATQLKFTLSGVDAVVLALAIGEDRDEYVGRMVTVWLQFFDSDWQKKGDPIARAAGIIDGIEISRARDQDGASIRTLTLTAENIFYGRGIPPAGNYTDRDQQFRFPGDRGLSFVNEVQNTVIQVPW